MRTYLEELAASEALRKTPIPEGHVRLTRDDYHYSRQGVITRVGHICRDLPEHAAADWLGHGGGPFSVTWPDGHREGFDFRVLPVEHHGHLGYGRIGKETGTLSRLLNVFVKYYGIRRITPDERDTFTLILDSYGNTI